MEINNAISPDVKEIAPSNAKRAILYFKCDTRSDVETLTSALTFRAEELGYLIVGSFFDRNDKPMHTLLSLIDLKRKDTSLTLLVQCGDCLGCDELEPQAMFMYLKNEGFKVVFLDKPILTPPIEALLYEIKKYNECDNGWESRYYGNKGTEDCMPASGRVPLGYKTSAGRIVIDQENADMVRDIFSMFASGVIPVRIVEKLTERYPSARCPVRNQLYSIVRNKRYIGIDSGKGGAYPQIVSPRLYLVASSAINSALPNGMHEFLFKRIRLSGVGWLEPDYEMRGARRPLYKLVRGKNAYFVFAAEIEELVESFVLNKYLISLKELKEEILAYLHAESEKASAAAASMTAELEAFRREAAEKYNSYCDIPSRRNMDVFDDTKARIALREIACAYLGFHSELLDQEEDDVDAFFSRLNDFASLKAPEKRYFLEIIIKSITVSDDEVCISVLGSKLTRTHLRCKTSLIHS